MNGPAGMRDNILAEVRKVVESKAKSMGSSMVIDVGAETPNATPIVLYTNGENDITAAVLEQLNANAPPESVKKSTDDKPASSPKK